MVLICMSNYYLYEWQCMRKVLISLVWSRAFLVHHHHKHHLHFCSNNRTCNHIISTHIPTTIIDILNFLYLIISIKNSYTKFFIHLLIQITLECFWYFIIHYLYMVKVPSFLSLTVWCTAKDLSIFWVFFLYFGMIVWGQ